VKVKQIKNLPIEMMKKKLLCQMKSTYINIFKIYMMSFTKCSISSEISGILFQEILLHLV
jgi:hypothetical protein